MPLQAAPGCLDDRHGIAPGGRLDVQVKMKTFAIANVPKEPHESPVALPFDPNEDDAPALDPTPPPHRASTKPRDSAKHTRPILRIEADITPQAPYILGTVQPRGPARILLDDENFLLLQIVEQANVMR